MSERLLGGVEAPGDAVLRLVDPRSNVRMRRLSFHHVVEAQAAHACRSDVHSVVVVPVAQQGAESSTGLQQGPGGSRKPDGQYTMGARATFGLPQ